MMKTKMSEEQIDEARKKTRVNSKGKKTKKVKCKKGYKVNKAGTSCVPMSGSEKARKKKAIKKSVRTKKASPGSKKKAQRKRAKAMKRRKSYSL